MLSNKGWIKTHRSLLHSDIFQNDKLLKIFIWCSLKASHTQHEQLVGRQKIKLCPGQFIFGRSKASVELGYAPSTVWDYMKLLEAKGTISIKSNNKFSIITIENWMFYQSDINNGDNKTDNRLTTEKQQKDTNKNVKNVKNKKLYVETSNEYRLAKYYFELIRKNNPGFKEPNIQTWSQHTDRMIRIDKRKVEDIKKVMEWCQNHDFWYSRVLSTDKLRKQYDQLVMQMKPKDRQNKGQQNDQQINKIDGKKYDEYGFEIITCD